MFEFGRDLKKLFEKARDGDDLGWVELIGVDLVEAEARRETTDAGRVSCTRPFAAWMKAAALWREHARRSGARLSLDRAAACASDAARNAAHDEDRTAAALEAGEIHLLRFDLFGGPERLTTAASDIQFLSGGRTATRAWAQSLSARLAMRRALTAEDAGERRKALALLDAAQEASRPLTAAAAHELALDRAALALEMGVERRDPALLDQAGHDLRTIVEAASPDYRPVTRARALVLAAMGLKALAALADDDAARNQARALFDAAAEQFTPDHSPLDWTAVQLAQAEADCPLLTLAQAEAMTAEPGLILGAGARERRMAAEAALAFARGDVQALAGLEAAIRRRLAKRTPVEPVDWAADQISMAHLMLARARLTHSRADAVGLILTEAMQTAREWGATTLVQRAAQMLRRQAEGCGGSRG